MALFFGLQSLQAYAVFGWFAQLWRDSGYSATVAGRAGRAARRDRDPALAVAAQRAGPQRATRAGVMFAVIVCYPIGYVGLMIAPYRLAPLWAVVVGVATVTFPLILTLIGLRARTPEGTAALSAFTQSTGYLIAAAGPFTVGVLHAATGGWTVPLALLLVLALPLFPLAAYVAKVAYVEDQLALSPAGR